jgi:hypothetical protein
MGLQLSGTAGATTVAITGSGMTYDLAVSGMTHDGTVIVNIPANVAHDAAGDGNEAWTGTTNQVVYDTTAPVTTSTLAGTLGTGGWYTSPVQVTLAATDATSGVASTSYTIDGGAAKTYGGTFTVIGDGTHTLTYFSTDKAGNIESTHTTTFKIDATAPMTTATLAGTLGNAGWYKGPVHVTLAATDATSGVASTSYRIDSGAVLAYTGVFTVTGDGTHTVTFFSTDHAGNVEHTETATVKIDTVPPTTSWQLFGTDGRLGNYSSDVRVPPAGSSSAPTGGSAITAAMSASS